eukprot:CAMPEP_0119361430 /NCGR_PEP_ID=MMETSP1334-20130426/8740_1 /TAXON_ID=127549 /ORGANISM="Calcidiscus leptoporus, Strain RCC1130" /LENGTH=45 /DNA_ID= /DNA_START= /DNA_END= /DNA_ORIENTATION=
MSTPNSYRIHTVFTAFGQAAAASVAATACAASSRTRGEDARAAEP